MTSGSTPRHRDTALPESIGSRYKVERVLGRGGMATVYLCRDEKTGDLVAVKVLREELGSAVVVERFLREIAFASELDHERIPKVLDSGVAGALPFYVMTYVEGESLRERLDRVKQLPVDEAVRITNAVIEPMTYAHRLGIVHRDIKPGNILVGDDTVHVLDFGIARAILVSAEERLTSTGVALGTPAYMSPEQALADGDLDARSDIYSLACVTYEMIAGIPPFVGATPQSVMARRFASPPSPLRDTREGVPPHVDRAVAKALSRAPADRWQTARAFGDALSSPVASESLHEVTARMDLRRRKYGRYILGTMAAALVLTAGIAAYSWQRDFVGRGKAALESADFVRAESEARRAVESDAASAEGHLLLARALNLQRRPAEEWFPHARFAAERAPDFPEDEQLVVGSLQALVAGNRGEACDGFSQNARRERARAPLSIAAGMEYADCLTRDSLVVPDAKSESGYAFRSSYAVADSIYSDLIERSARNARAFGVAFSRLESVLPIHKAGFRNGALGGNSRRLFRALPSLAGDTVAFVPYENLLSGQPWKGGDIAAVDRAITRNRAKLRALAQRWVALEPASADAHAAASRILESLGIFEGPGESAEEHIRRARHFHALNRTSSADSYLRQLRLGIDHVRLSLRLSRFDQAGVIADSVLAARMPDGIDEANRDTAAALLASLAAVRGRAGEMIRHGQRFAAKYPARTPDGERILLPAAVGGELIRLDAYAAFGASPDSITASTRRLEASAFALMPESYSRSVSRAILSRPLSLAAPVTGAGPLQSLGPQSELFARALLANAKRDVRRARSLLDSLHAIHSAYAPGEITMDVIFSESWLRADLGDTVGATRELDNGLRGFPAALPTILRQPPLVGFFVRAMALRATLASASGDKDGAAYWSDAVVNLWGDGDTVVAPTLEQARRARRD